MVNFHSFVCIIVCTMKSNGFTLYLSRIRRKKILYKQCIVDLCATFLGKIS